MKMYSSNGEESSKAILALPFLYASSSGSSSGSNRLASSDVSAIFLSPVPANASMYKVLMLNDDYTPMEFVIHVLERFFGKTHEEATDIMLSVHQTGVGVCGVYTYEVAEMKVTRVMDLARQNQHPLQCTLEKA